MSTKLDNRFYRQKSDDYELQSLRDIKARAEHALSIASSEAVNLAVRYILEGPQGGN